MEMREKFSKPCILPERWITAGCPLMMALCCPFRFKTCHFIAKDSRGFSEGAVSKVCISVCGGSLCVPQQFSNITKAKAAGNEVRGMGMPQIMNTQIVCSRDLFNLAPKGLNIL